MSDMNGFGEDTGQADVDAGTEKGGSKKDDSGSGGLLDTVKAVTPLLASSSGLCASACGDSKDKQQQKDNINSQHPLTGDPATDAAIQAQRDASFKAWQKADDIQKFDQLSPPMKAMLPAAKAFTDKIASMLPPDAMGLTLSQAAAKYPDIAASAWSAIQTAFPTLKSMPLDYALSLAKASGLGDTKLSDIKQRVDDLYASRSGTAAAASASGTATMALGGLAIVAVLIGGIALFKKK